MTKRTLLPLTDRDRDTLDGLERRAWKTPLDIGSWNGSHHANTLRKLVVRGLVETKQRRERHGATGPNAYDYTTVSHRRGSRAYRLTKAGERLVAENAYTLADDPRTRTHADR